jgi:hypothetical protein
MRPKRVGVLTRREINQINLNSDLHLNLIYILLLLLLLLFFTDASTLCGSWPPPWLRNSKFSRLASLVPARKTSTWSTRNHTSSGPYTLICLAWVALTEFTLQLVQPSRSLGCANLSTIRRFLICLVRAAP